MTQEQAQQIMRHDIYDIYLLPDGKPEVHIDGRFNQEELEALLFLVTNYKDKPQPSIKWYHSDYYKQLRLKIG